MRVILKSAVAAAAIAGFLALTGSGPAAAQVAGPRVAAELGKASAGAIQVQWRRWGGRPYWRYRYWRPGWGWGWGPVGAGFATGLIVGGAAAAPYAYPYAYPYSYAAPRPAPANAVAYCEQRYRSYDPASGTYLGYDGHRHPCP